MEDNESASGSKYGSPINLGGPGSAFNPFRPTLNPFILYDALLTVKKSNPKPKLPAKVTWKMDKEADLLEKLDNIKDEIASLKERLQRSENALAEALKPKKIIKKINPLKIAVDIIE